MMEYREKEDSSALDALTAWGRRWISSYDVRVFGFSLLLVFVTHLYMFTNKFVNHDDVGDLLDRVHFGVAYGRWMLNLISCLGGDFSSAWLNGVLGAMFLALGVLFTVKMFRLRRLPSAVLVAGVMVGFPVVASTYTYMFVAYQFFFSLALAAAGAWCISHERLPWLLGGALCVALSTGTYQAYFAFAAALTLTSFLLDLCEGRWGRDGKRALGAAVKYAAALGVGMLLYYIIMKVSLAATGQQLVSYQGIDQMGVGSLSELLERIPAAYRGYFSFFMNRTGIFHSAILPLSGACMLAGLLGMVLGLRRTGVWRSPLCLLLAAACVALFPLASSLTNVMSPAGTHTVMQYSMVVTLLLPGFLVERCPLPTEPPRRRAAVAAVSLLLLLELSCGYEGFVITNRAYFYLDLTYENLYAYYTRLAAKIELTEGYTPESEVAMLGTHAMGSVLEPLSMTGVFSGNDAANIYTWRLFLREFLAADFREPPRGILESLRASETFREMPEYPAAGSIRTIDGVIVVKLHQEGP